jgi:ubiquitin C-terminal hydrolase
VEYCTLECQEKDEKWHISKCEYANQLSVENFVVEPRTTQSSLGKSGLQNIGNTCYMASALQCVFNIPHLRNFFLSGEFLPEINKTNSLGSKGQIALFFA